MRFVILISTVIHVITPQIKSHAKMSMDLILHSLLGFFSQFIVNFNMNKIHASLSKLLNMLTTAKGNL